MEELKQKLLAEYARLRGETRTLAQTMYADGHVVTAEEQQEYERRNADLDTLEVRIRELDKRIRSDAQIDEMRANSEATFAKPDVAPGRNPGDARWGDDPIAKRAIEWARGGGSRELVIPLAGLQAEWDDSRGRKVVREYRSTLTEGAQTAGGVTVPTSFRAVLYEHMIQHSAIRQTRATILTTSSGEALPMPKTTAHPANGTIVSEGSSIGEADPTFGAGTLHAYKYGNLVQVSHELLADTAVDMLGYLARAMGRALGDGAGAHYITGTGSSQPQGVLVGAGTVAQVNGGTGISGVATYAELVALYDAVIPAYQAQGEWLLSQTTLSKLRRIVDSQNRPLWIESLSADMPNQLFGHNFYVDPNMPNAGTSATSIAFGDFSTYFIRDVEALRFERSDDFAFDKDMVTFRALMRTDGLLLDTTGAIGVYKGGTA